MSATVNMIATVNAVDWLERAPGELAKLIEAPPELRQRLVSVLVSIDQKGIVQVDVRLDVGVGRSLSCRSGKTLVDAVWAVQEVLREKGMSF